MRIVIEIDDKGLTAAQVDSSSASTTSATGVAPSDAPGHNAGAAPAGPGQMPAAPGQPSSDDGGSHSAGGAPPLP